VRFVLLLIVSAAFGQYRPPRVLAEVDVPKLTESSGLAASRLRPGVFWSHNDSGGGPWLYAFDRTGKDLGHWSVRAARSNDWEDIAIGPGPKPGVPYIYIGDIGDNRSSRKFVTVYRIPEPNVHNESRETALAESFRFRYPDEPHDAEALLVHPTSGDLYVVTKARGKDRDTVVFKAKAPLRSGAVAQFERAARLEMPNASVFTLLIGRINGGDISPDGTRVVLCDYFRAWEAIAPNGSAFDSVWSGPWHAIELGPRQQGESVCYRHDGRAILATSEGERFPLIEVEREPGHRVTVKPAGKK
jgi:hypothetical protein